MAKPAIITVDDDTEVLRAIERDLRRQYSSDYRILRAESGPVGAGDRSRTENPERCGRTFSR